MQRSTSIAAALAAAMLSAFVLTGCGQTAEAQAQGTYELDRDRARADVQEHIDSLEEDSEERAEMEMFANILNDMSVTLVLRDESVAEMSMTMMGMTEQDTGTWTIDGEAIRITSDTGDTVTGTLRNGALELDMSDDDGEMPFPMVLRRVED